MSVVINDALDRAPVALDARGPSPWEKVKLKRAVNTSVSVTCQWPLVPANWLKVKVVKEVEVGVGGWWGAC